MAETKFNVRKYAFINCAVCRLHCRRNGAKGLPTFRKGILEFDTSPEVAIVYSHDV